MTIVMSKDFNHGGVRVHITRRQKRDPQMVVRKGCRRVFTHLKASMRQEDMHDLRAARVLGYGEWL